jgi:uncharacterized membrane protein
MAGQTKRVKQGNKREILRLASIILAFLGAAVSSYLLVLKYTQAVVMCAGSHGCITVSNSPYSMIYGVPVALIGFTGYIVIAVQLLLENKMAILKEQGPLFVFGETLIGFIFSAYLTWIELYVIHAICPFCVASAIIMTLLFILAVIRLVKHSTN